MSKADIIRALAQGNYSVNDLTEILYAVRRARRTVSKSCASVFFVNEKVSFIEKGKPVTGVISKVNKSSVIVSIANDTKKVSLISLMRA